MINHGFQNMIFLHNHTNIITKPYIYNNNNKIWENHLSTWSLIFFLWWLSLSNFVNFIPKHAPWFPTTRLISHTTKIQLYMRILHYTTSWALPTFGCCHARLPSTHLDSLNICSFNCCAWLMPPWDLLMVQLHSYFFQTCKLSS